MKLSTTLAAAALAALLALPAAAQNNTQGGQNGTGTRQNRGTTTNGRRTGMRHRLGQTTTSSGSRSNIVNIRSEALDKDNSDIGQANRIGRSRGIEKDNSSILGPGNGSATTLTYTPHRIPGRNNGTGNSKITSLQGYRVAGVIRTNGTRTRTHHRATTHHRRHRR